MKKIIGIIAGDPNSINSEIIAKTWKKKSNFRNLDIFIIGSFFLLKKQFQKMGYKTNLKKINEIQVNKIKKNLCIYNIPINFKKPFEVPASERRRYIDQSFKIALNFINQKKINGIINCAVNKKDLSQKKNFNGVTEFLAKKSGVLGNEAMLIYNNSLSVCPITTHIKLRSVPKNISKNKIIKKTIAINSFFKKILKIKPKIGVLGLNPHNDEFRNNSEEKKIIKPAVNYLKKRGISVQGPISPDTVFLDYKKKGFNVLIGMYHDQVLTPFKAIFKFDAINITVGLPFIRISPDHGVGKDIIQKNKANPESLLKSINFFNKINAKT
tara:strand:- start:1815 stop:2792 length:978 start_codon:yes stop_codon:yes gene_type:complete